MIEQRLETHKFLFSSSSFLFLLLSFQRSEIVKMLPEVNGRKMSLTMSFCVCLRCSARVAVLPFLLPNFWSSERPFFGRKEHEKIPEQNRTFSVESSAKLPCFLSHSQNENEWKHTKQKRNEPRKTPNNTSLLPPPFPPLAPSPFIPLFSSSSTNEAKKAHSSQFLTSFLPRNGDRKNKNKIG